MNKHLSIIICVACILCSCADNKTAQHDGAEIISIDPNDAEESIKLSELVDSITFIRLQPEANDVVGRVADMIIKKKYIYVLDASQKILFVFDKNGRFVSKLDKRGQGPDEYSVLYGAFIDDEEEYVEIKDYRNMLKYSNISFKLIDKKPAPDISYDFVRRNSGMYYFGTDQQDNTINGQATNAEIIIADGQMDSLSILFDKKIETNHSYFTATGGCFTENDKNELFFSTMYHRTFYRLEGRESHPVFIVDFGKYNMSESAGMLSTSEQMESIKNTRNKATFPMLNINNENLMCFSYFFKQEDTGMAFYKQRDLRFYIKDKRRDKVYHVKKIINDLTDFPAQVYLYSFPSYPHEAWYEDYLVDVILPHTCFEDSDKDHMYVEGIGEITSEDDPIIVFMKLKK
jgi:hypothetical protein